MADERFRAGRPKPDIDLELGKSEAAEDLLRKVFAGEGAGKPLGPWTPEWWRALPLRRRIVLVGIVAGCLWALCPPTESLAFVDIHGNKVWEFRGLYPILLPAERMRRVEYARTILGFAAIAGLTTAAALLVSGRKG